MSRQGVLAEVAGDGIREPARGGKQAEQGIQHHRNVMTIDSPRCGSEIRKRAYRLLHRCR
jgi:hypothetical protein